MSEKRINFFVRGSPQEIKKFRGGVPPPKNIFKKVRNYFLEGYPQKNIFFMAIV
jgi:hypothetical protein